MSTLYVIRALPNPRGKDTTRPGYATNEQLNEEWVEFEAVGGDRALVGDIIYNLVFTDGCRVKGEAEVTTFVSGSLPSGHRLRLHTGRGTNQTIGTTQHVYVGRTWYIWNNACGDRVAVRYRGTLVDSAGWAPNAPEGVLIRVPGSDLLRPAANQAA